MEKNLAKNYDPKAFEDRIYKDWEESGAFKAERDPDKKPFTIVMPPPNITGQLHMGHALDQTLQDVLTRWKRMQGFSALWLPGTDHASIATEVKVADKLREDTGKTKEEIGREAFLERAWAWKKEFGDRITTQCRKLGSSCDWSRERFTMDEGCSRAVNEFFVRLYDKGLIYKGKRLVNWCPSCGTSLSDAEVEHEDIDGSYWYFRYPGADGSDGIVVATSRPETMFGDTAIAVSPEDERYKDLVGKTVILPIVGREIPIIADEYPDPEKGTGAVKITPAHDPNDFLVGQRHDLEIIQCIGPDAKMTAEAGKYEGQDRYECRKNWVAELEEAGYLVKIEKMSIPAGHCYRCHTVVEDMLSDQWFVKMDGLAKRAIEASEKGELTYVPERFEKTHLHWLENIRDWCISRQLWWGHRIPAYYCEDCGEIVVSAKGAPEKCPKCGGVHFTQDEDVLDTWFSSGLWPFSTLGWPEETEDLKYFFPTDVLVTGYDIIFFWVIRMVFSSLEMMGEVPFHHVYIHGLVRDALGRKMSKSLGNGIDPLEIIDKYGADALRFTLTSGISPGNDMRFSTDKIEAARNFANKLWNASRFIIMNLPEGDPSVATLPQEFRETEYKTHSKKNETLSEAEGSGDAEKKPVENDPLSEAKGLGDAERTSVENETLSEAKGLSTDGTAWTKNLRDEDKWILSRINDAAKYMTASMERYEPGLAVQRVYDLIWSEFCDWYIELAKGRLYGDDEADKAVCLSVLVYSLKEMLKLLHPFLPFITEEIWSYLPKAEGEGHFLMKEAWPEYREELNFPEEEKRLESAMEAIKAIRAIRLEAEAAPSKKLSAIVVAAGDALSDLKAGERYIKDLANLSDIEFSESLRADAGETMSAVINGAEVFIPLDELVDYKAEAERLEKEKKRLEGEVARGKGMISNPGFVSKAPEAKIAAEKEKLANYEEQLAKVESRLITVKEKL